MVDARIYAFLHVELKNGIEVIRVMRSSLENLNDQRKPTIDSTRSAGMERAVAIVTVSSVSFCFIMLRKVSHTPMILRSPTVNYHKENPKDRALLALPRILHS